MRRQEYYDDCPCLHCRGKRREREEDEKEKEGVR
jgi:hypothetical protein